jgi:hypothetical protein
MIKIGNNWEIKVTVVTKVKGVGLQVVEVLVLERQV